MLKRKIVLATALGLGFLSLLVTQAQQKTASVPKNMTLTALDYIEIGQLVNKYAFAIDNCTNSGYDYSDLYTPDGTFTSGMDGRVYTGREELAQAAGGGARGCRQRTRMSLLSHTTVNHVIEPTPEGAKGKSYLVYPGVLGQHAGPDNDGHVGGYQDLYVKTPNGWRIQSRIHVHPPQIPGDYSGIPKNNLPGEKKP